MCGCLSAVSVQILLVNGNIGTGAAVVGAFTLVLFFALSACFILVLTKINFGAASRFEKHIKITIPESFDSDGLFDDVFEKYGVLATLEKIRTTNMEISATGKFCEEAYIIEKVL